ncbi:MAG: protein kinase [Planctomycetota bacterium]
MSDDPRPGAKNTPGDSGRGIPARIGRFPVLSLLGRGGMGEVYLAEDESLRRHVAIKVLKARVAQDPVWLHRFESEARAVSSLEHPNIVPIYEYGQDGDRRFFVMRAVDGAPLNLWVKKLRWEAMGEAPVATTMRHTEHDGDSTTLADDTPLLDAPSEGSRGTRGGTRPGVSGPRTQTAGSADASGGESAAPEFGEGGEDVVAILEIIEKCADALAYAHRRGVLHRDVKPSNIVIDTEGNPQLLDFGLARVLGKEELAFRGRPPRGAVVGTLPYVAPEQFAGDGELIDHRADIYALGVTLYECLCGSRPFVANTTDELVFQIVGRNPRPPHEIRGGISRDLETVVLKALEKEPDHRYQSAEEFAQDLHNLRFLQEIDARPVTRAVRIARFANRRPVLSGLLALLAVLALVLPTVWAVTAVRARAEQRRVDAYTRHVRRAESLDAERRALSDALRRDARALDELEAATPRHLTGASDEKRRLFAARADLAAGRRRLAALAGEIEYELQLSRETVDPYSPDDRERVQLYRRLHAEARARGDVVQEEKYRLFLAAAGESPGAGDAGRLTLRTEPAGALATLVPLVEGPDGIRRADRDRAVVIGRTPVEDREVRVGSYVVELALDGHHPVPYPILVETDEHWGAATWHGGLFADRDWTVRLSPLAAYEDEDWARVARGPYQGGPEEDPSLGAPPRWRWVEDVLVAREELDFADYLEFLDRPDALRAITRHQREMRDDPESLRARGLRASLIYLPRRMESGHPVVGIAQGRVVLPEGDPGFDVEGAVMGISKVDAEAYLAWLESTKGLKARLPSADEWQKALRGVDGRQFAWGDVFDWSYCASRHAEPPTGAPRAYAHPPRSFAEDRSVYGIWDLTGNVSEWCADGPAADNPLARSFWYAGGSYAFGSPYMYVAQPWNHVPWEYVAETLGMRLVRDL